MDANAARNDPDATAGGGAPDLKLKPLTWTLLASRLGVSSQTLREWRAKLGAPESTDWGAWDAFVKESGLGTKGFGTPLKDEKLRHEIEILKARLAREHRQVIAREEVSRLLLHISTRGQTMLYQFLETEAPPKLAGMSAAQMRPILREMADEICEAMGGLIDEFDKQ